MPHGDQKEIRKMGKRQKAVAPQTPAVGMKMKTVRAAAAAHLPQGSTLTQTPSELCSFPQRWDRELPDKYP